MDEEMERGSVMDGYYDDGPFDPHDPRTLLARAQVAEERYIDAVLILTVVQEMSTSPLVARCPFSCGTTRDRDGDLVHYGDCPVAMIEQHFEGYGRQSGLRVVGEPQHEEGDDE